MTLQRATAAPARRPAAFSASVRKACPLRALLFLSRRGPAAGSAAAPWTDSSYAVPPPPAGLVKTILPRRRSPRSEALRSSITGSKTPGAPPCPFVRGGGALRWGRARQGLTVACRGVTVARATACQQQPQPLARSQAGRGGACPPPPQAAAVIGH